MPLERFPIVISGFAIDPSAAYGTGISAVRLWAFPKHTGLPSISVPTLPVGNTRNAIERGIDLGSAAYGHPRADVAAQFGAQFTNSGFSKIVDQTQLPGPENYVLQAIALRESDGSWLGSNDVAVSAQGSQVPVGGILTPATSPASPAAKHGISAFGPIAFLLAAGAGFLAYRQYKKGDRGYVSSNRSAPVAQGSRARTVRRKATRGARR